MSCMLNPLFRGCLLLSPSYRRFEIFICIKNEPELSFQQANLSCLPMSINYIDHPGGNRDLTTFSTITHLYQYVV